MAWDHLHLLDLQVLLHQVAGHVVLHAGIYIPKTKFLDGPKVEELVAHVVVLWLEVGVELFWLLHLAIPLHCFQTRALASDHFDAAIIAEHL